MISFILFLWPYFSNRHGSYSGRRNIFFIYIITMVKLAKAFNRSGGFAVGLIFLGVIFYCILAFDTSTYVGVPQSA